MLSGTETGRWWKLGHLDAYSRAEWQGDRVWSPSYFFLTSQSSLGVSLSSRGPGRNGKESMETRGLGAIDWLVISMPSLRLSLPLCAFLKFIYLFIWLSWVLVVVCGIFVATCRIFSCGMRALSCSMRDLVPWPGIEPRPPALGARSLNH